MAFLPKALPRALPPTVESPLLLAGIKGVRRQVRRISWSRRGSEDREQTMVKTEAAILGPEGGEVKPRERMEKSLIQRRGQSL